MHANQMAEIAAWAAFNSTALIEKSTALTVKSCNSYWSQSKVRQNRWMIALKMFESDLSNEYCNHDPWPAIEIVVQEIFISEMLTRIWSAAMVAHDNHYASDEMTGIAHSIHIGHLEAKNRSMRLLLNENSVATEVFERINRLRRKVERWTDLLLGQFADSVAVQRFGFQHNRVKDFSEENQEVSPQDIAARRVLYSAAMIEDLSNNVSRYSANPDINRKIVGGVLACFSSEQFDSLGMPKSVRLLWMEKAADETELLFDSLQELDHEFLPVTSKRGEA